MTKQQNTIRLNGKLYDAVTGQPVDGSTGVKSQPKHAKNTTKHKANKSAAPPKTSKVKNRFSASASHRQPHHLHRTVQHSHTLMRQSVKKPIPVNKDLKITDLHASTPASHNIEPGSSLDIMAVKHNLSNRAARISKSHLIHRFDSHDESTPSVVKRIAKLSVKPAPDEPVIEKHAYAPVSGHAPTDLFSNALVTATSHKQTHQAHGKRQRMAKKLGVTNRILHIGMGVVAIIALGGFIFYQNVPNIRVRLAANDAGIHASLPGYSPPSFALDHTIQAFPGEVVLSFHSDTDGRNFRITQTAAPTAGASVADSLMTDTGQHYQSITGNHGITIYLYGNTSAAWAKGNTWYTIAGNSSLSSSQLLKIANSF